MPRIQAASVAENRDLRRMALMSAAGDLHRIGGDAAVTMSAAAGAAGISRPAAYEYFHSSAELLGELVDRQAERWTSMVALAMTEAGDVADIVQVFVRTSLRAVAEDAPRKGLTGEQISRLHQGPARELSYALASAGVVEPTLAARLVTGAVVAIARTHDQDEGCVPSVTEFLLTGLAGLSAAQSPP